jgi:hypothetical protein
MRRRNLLLGSLCLGLGATLIGTYVWRERAAQWSLPERVEIRAPSLVQHYLLTSDGTPVGFSTLTLDRTSTGVVVREDAELRVRTPDGQVQALVQQSEQHLGGGLDIERFSVVLRSGPPGAASNSMEISGARDEDRGLRVELRNEDEVRWHYVVPTRSTVLGPGVWPRLAASLPLQEGTRRIFDEIEPSSLALQPSEIVVGPAESVRVRAGGTDIETDARVVTHTVGIRSSRIWVDGRGIPLRAELPLGILLEAVDEGAVRELRAGWARRDPALMGAMDLIGRSAIGSGVRLQGREDVGAVRFLLSGLAQVPPWIDGDGQRLAGDSLLVFRAQWPPRPGYALGQAGAPSALAANRELAPYLGPTPFIESDHPEIVAAAREALRGETDPGEAARRISESVHQRLAKRYRVGIPSAIDVLRSGEGDCNEHTMLAVAMMRAAGIPARPVSGFALAGGAFYPHAWVEVWLGTWVALDPTFGQVPADAARVRLFVGAENLNSVLGVAGRLRLTVLRAY